MYCLTMCVQDHMLSYIRDANTLKADWDNLKWLFTASSTTRKLDLRQELNNIQQRSLSMLNYTVKIKDLCDSLGAINVNIEDDEMV